MAVISRRSHPDGWAGPDKVRIVALALLLSSAPPCIAQTIAPDGILDPGEWEGAIRIDDFRVTQPFTAARPAHPVQAWLKAVPEGLGVAIRVDMPPGVARSRQPVQHDFSAKVDRVNISVDFEGNGRTAYNFYVASTGATGDAVLTNEDAFNYGWDGDWRHGVGEDPEGWTAEVLIPWHTAPMPDAIDGKRTIRLYLDRIIASTGERAAWPTASLERARFLSDFAAVEIPGYSRSLLAVTPYVSVLYDNSRGRGEWRAGADVFWKPDGGFQLSATLNPDFGQVESDDLVVNFTAIETFVREKRPFFTENQSFFDFVMPSNASQLLYTRRIGARADDGGDNNDVRAALKVNSSVDALKIGALYAEEDDSAGRRFGALRLMRDFDTQSVGLMVTRVDRPFFDRTATVIGVDHDWQRSPRLKILGRVVRSRVDQRGARTEGTGATVLVNYDPDEDWRHQFVAMHFGRDFQINDAGFLARNDLDYAHWQVSRRFARIAESSRYASKLWRWRWTEARNTAGDRLQRQLRINRQSTLRNGSLEVLQLNLNGSGVDDLFMRGNGKFRRPSSFDLYGEYGSPRKGDFAYKGFVEIASGGLSGNDRIGGRIGFEPTYFISDALSFSARFSYAITPDSLVWQGRRSESGRDVIGRFEQTSLQIDAGVDWNISGRQELRIKLQALGLDAKSRQTVLVLPDGRLVPAAVMADSFSIRNLGFQVRYRYRIAPLSDLYVVYARGGYDERPQSIAIGDLFDDVFGLRDDEQFLVKLSYRFER
jgi:hypothetical protein